MTTLPPQNPWITQQQPGAGALHFNRLRLKQKSLALPPSSSLGGLPRVEQQRHPVWRGGEGHQALRRGQGQVLHYPGQHHHHVDLCLIYRIWYQYFSFHCKSEQVQTCSREGCTGYWVRRISGWFKSRKSGNFFYFLEKNTSFSFLQ